MRTKAIAMCLGLLLGGTYTAIILSVEPELPEPPIWCLYGEYPKDDWRALENKPDSVYIEFNGPNLVVYTNCS